MAMSRSLKDKLQSLNLSGKRKKALNLLKLKRGEGGDAEVELKYAWFLYHIALDEKQGTERNRDIKEAKRIYESVLRGVNYKSDNLTLEQVNAFMCYAQVLAVLGNDKAVIYAVENYKKNLSSLAANRLADVYDRLGQYRKALWWYKKSINLAATTNELLMSKTALSIFYEQRSQLNKSKELRKEIDKILLTLEKKTSCEGAVNPKSSRTARRRSR